MANEKTCKHCKEHIDFEPTDHMFHGTNTYSLKGKEIDGCKDISVELYMDAKNRFLKATTNVFGMDVWSKDIKIKYCPFCGRKL